jgi:hypothetical protein
VGWPPNTPAAQRHKTVGKVVAQVPSKNRNIVQVDWNGVKTDCLPPELELAAETCWVLFREAHRIDVNNRSRRAFEVLPRSREIIIERAFSDGKKRVRFAVGRTQYRVEFPSFEYYVETESGNMLEGTLRRFPPRKWERPKRPVSFDDGLWHVLSIAITGRSARALCDGEPIPVEFEGEFEETIMHYRSRDDLCSANIARKTKRETKKKIVDPSPGNDDSDSSLDLGLFDEDDSPVSPKAPKPPRPKNRKAIGGTQAICEVEESDNEECREVEPPLGKSIGELLPFCVAKPVVVFHTKATRSSATEEFRQESFPERYMSYLNVEWGKIDFAKLQARHKAINEATMWVCTECLRGNLRTLRLCEECCEPRAIKADTTRDSDRRLQRLRVGLLKSKETSQLRGKLTAKLRAMFQTQLDCLLNPEQGDEDLQDLL